ncbi:MAG TPA: hypothetical protein VMG08_02825 [Allosphingosinicella sp.]|nr:hypothetical protein [Allosphingosinicella sp.]
MSFQEKSRWIALTANLLVWGWYFVTLARILTGDIEARIGDQPGLLAMMVPVIVAITIIHIVGHAVVAALKPSEARTGLDEREKAIARHASAIGYNVLCVGIALALGTTLYYWTAFAAINTVMLAFIVAESVRYGVEIAHYRGGLAG